MSKSIVEPLSLRERGRGEGRLRQKLPLPEALLTFSRQLRESGTIAEQKMWFLLRDRRFLGLKFRRQHAMPPYVLDFYCDELRLAVELDGGQHNEDREQADDEQRCTYLEKHGVNVVRYWNHDVLNQTNAVLEDLMLRVRDRRQSLTPAPLPEGEGKEERST